MGDKKRYYQRKTSKKRGHVRYRQESALMMRNRASEIRAAQAAEQNKNESSNEGRPGNANEGEVEESGLVQVQVVADIHIPPSELQPVSLAQPQTDSPAQPHLDSQVQPQPNSPDLPQPNFPVQPQPHPPVQQQPHFPVQSQPDSPVQDPVPRLMNTPHRYSHKGPAKKTPRSPRNPRREAKKRYFRQSWKDVRNSRTSEEDIDDPDGITVASDDSTSETIAGFSGFSLNSDVRRQCQINPLLDIQDTTGLQPASSKRISRPLGASEEADSPPASAETQEGRHVDHLDRTILNLDTPKPTAGTV